MRRALTIFCIVGARLSLFLPILGNNDLNYPFKSIFIVNLTGIGYGNNNNNRGQVWSFSKGCLASSSISLIIIIKIN